MSVEGMVAAYGYPVLVLGTILEGETFVIIGGFLAHRGYLSLPWVMIAAFLGSYAGDQFFFQMGRKKGAALLERKPQWKPRVKRVHGLLDRYHVAVILGFRFLYGLRAVTPFVIGMSRFSVSRFMLLNGIGAVLWSVAIASAGYLFGQILESLMGDLERYELWIVTALFLVGLAVWALHQRSVRRMGDRKA